MPGLLKADRFAVIGDFLLSSPGTEPSSALCLACLSRLVQSKFNCKDAHVSY